MTEDERVKAAAEAFQVDAACVAYDEADIWEHACNKRAMKAALAAYDATRPPLDPATVEASLIAEVNMLKTALKRCYDVRDDAEKVADAVIQAIAPAAPITEDDMAWAGKQLARLEAGALVTPGEDG